MDDSSTVVDEPLSRYIFTTIFLDPLDLWHGHLLGLGPPQLAILFD